MTKKTAIGNLMRQFVKHGTGIFPVIMAILLAASSAEGVSVSPPSCASIQNAINGLPSTGGEVLLQPGTYTCSTAIVIDRNNVQLKGIGYPTLRLANGANSPVLVVGQTVTAPTTTRSNVEITNIQIDGNRLNQTMECWGGVCDTGGRTAIRNSGIAVRRGTNVSIRDVTVRNARSAGVVTERTSRFVTIERLRAYSNQFDGLAAYQTEDSVFSGLYIYSNLAAGLSFDLGFNRNVVSDSVIRDNGSVGIFMRHSIDNMFDGIQLLRSGEHGIFLAENLDTHRPASGNTFSNMVVAQSGVKPAPAPAGAGIRVNDSSCINNLVVGSQFIANEGGAISEVTPGLVSVFGTKLR